MERELDRKMGREREGWKRELKLELNAKNQKTKLFLASSLSLSLSKKPDDFLKNQIFR